MAHREVERVAVGSESRERALDSTLEVSGLFLASRVLGLVREQLFAASLGAGVFADAFVVAFRIPNLLRNLFAEGALSSAFMPMFVRTESEHGKEAAHDVANKVLSAISITTGVLVVLGIVSARPIAWSLASGFEAVPGKLELTARLTGLMMPLLLLLSLAAVMTSMLNARGRFGVPALAPALSNVALTAVGIGLWVWGAGPGISVIGWSLGALLGGFLQLAVLFRHVRRDGLRLRLRVSRVLSDPGVRQIARLMPPAILALAATEINLLVNTQFASSEAGANAWLSYAFSLMYVPIGIFGVAIAAVTARDVVYRAAERDVAGVRDGMAEGLRHVAFLMVPATLALAVLADPIIALLYEHGRFTAADTVHTSWALKGYAVGLYAYAGVKVIAPAFYALDKPRVPLLGAVASVAANLVVGGVAHRLLTPYGIGYVGLAVGTSLGALVNLLILGIALHRVAGGGSAPRGVLQHLARVVIASTAMAGVVFAFLWGIDTLLVAQGVGRGNSIQFVRVLGGAAVGTVVYVVACRVFRVVEIEAVLAALNRRLTSRGRR